jgi:hypothetical protein
MALHLKYVHDTNELSVTSTVSYLFARQLIQAKRNGIPDAIIELQEYSTNSILRGIAFYSDRESGVEIA